MFLLFYFLAVKHANSHRGLAKESRRIISRPRHPLRPFIASNSLGSWISPTPVGVVGRGGAAAGQLHCKAAVVACMMMCLYIPNIYAENHKQTETSIASVHSLQFVGFLDFTHTMQKPLHFAKPRWELLGEAARLLDSCIAKLQS
jgi:hypothetical protein